MQRLMNINYQTRSNLRCCSEFKAEETGLKVGHSQSLCFALLIVKGDQPSTSLEGKNA